jgi:RNA polymerase sigma-70 factor, ECF subfamily
VRNVERDDGASLAEIEAIYRRRFAAFARTATAILADADAGRDAVQEAFATAVRRRADFRGEGSLEGWLWRIVVNAARAERRARPATAVALAEQAAASVSPNGRVSDSEAALVRELLAELPERQRLVVFLRYFADLEHARIAEALEIRPGTVAATLNAAHAALRRRLEEVTP